MIQFIDNEIPVRLETGPLRFGSDWPGYFIRGDEAVMGWAQMFRILADSIEGRGDTIVPLSAFPDNLRRKAAAIEECWIKD